jgi:hypothetical protein
MIHTVVSVVVGALACVGFLAIGFTFAVVGGAVYGLGTALVAEVGAVSAAAMLAAMAAMAALAWALAL